MKTCYINSAVCISAQDTFNCDTFLSETIKPDGNKWKAQHPNYKEFFSPVASRRMATAVKMGLAAATKTLANANIETPDAILTGTGLGCIEDTEKFLNSIIANDEEYLTPTAFIHSTHNTVGSQIALSLNCRGYNNTFVQATNSLESALIDAKLLIEENEAKNILVGGIDELGNEFIDYMEMMEQKEQEPIKVPFSEGASFFLLSDSPERNCVKLNDVEIIHRVSVDLISQRMKDFLEINSLKSADIDLLVLGRNGDAFDPYYDQIDKEVSVKTASISYKSLSGEYFTASGFGLWLGYNILKFQKIPDALIGRTNFNKPIKNILLYNQFKGKGHSFTLLSK